MGWTLGTVSRWLWVCLSSSSYESCEKSHASKQWSIAALLKELGKVLESALIDTLYTQVWALYPWQLNSCLVILSRNWRLKSHLGLKVIENLGLRTHPERWRETALWSPATRLQCCKQGANSGGVLCLRKMRGIKRRCKPLREGLFCYLFSRSPRHFSYLNNLTALKRTSKC